MKNKAYYITQGCLHAFGKQTECDVKKLLDSGNISWQAKAFQEGVNSAVPRGTGGKCTHGITSHLKNLVEQWKRESVTNPYGSKLGNRIYGKIKFLCKKHKLNHVEIFNSVDWPVAV